MAAAWLRGGVAFLFLLALLPFAAHPHRTSACEASECHCAGSGPCAEEDGGEPQCPAHDDQCPGRDGHACKCPCHAAHANVADARWALAPPGIAAARHRPADDRVPDAAPHRLDQPPKLPA
jgi:hypothetical protein